MTEKQRLRLVAIKNKIAEMMLEVEDMADEDGLADDTEHHNTLMDIGSDLNDIEDKLIEITGED